MSYWRNGRYLCRSVRRGDRVRFQYLGCGLVAVLRALLDEEDRERRRAALAARRTIEQRDRQGFQVARLRAARVDALVRSGLEACGFWRPHRKSWRRRKEAMKAPMTAARVQAVQEATYELAD